MVYSIQWWKWSLTINQLGDNKPEIVLEPKVLWTLSFCIALCSFEFLLDLVVLGDIGLALVLGKDEVCSTFWCSKMKRLLCNINLLQRPCVKNDVDYRMLLFWQKRLKAREKKVRNFTRLTVTTCLYLSPSNRARSLSTLIAVVVEKDTPLNTRHAVVKRIQRV